MFPFTSRFILRGAVSLSGGLKEQPCSSLSGILQQRDERNVLNQKIRAKVDSSASVIKVQDKEGTGNRITAKNRSLNMIIIDHIDECYWCDNGDNFT